MSAGHIGPSDRNAWTVGPTSIDLTRPARPSTVVETAGAPANLRLDLARTAIVVIDMQNDFCHADGWLASIGVDVAAARVPIGPLAEGTVKLAVVRAPDDEYDASVLFEVWEPGGAQPPNSHADSVETFWFLRGEGVATSDGVEHPVGPGQLLVLPAGSVHHIRNTGTGRLYAITTMTPDGGFAALVERGPENLTTHRAAERYGWVWVTLSDDPLLPIPEIPEFGADGWRVISEPESDWDCTAVHLIDNNIDPGHIAYVHRESFGTPSKAEIEAPDVEPNEFGMRLRYEVEVEARPGEEGTTVRNTSNQIYGPFLMMNRITYPDGVVHLMVKACTPATATTTHQLQMVLRNDTETDRPAADIVAFDAQVWQEDQDVLHHCWTDFRTELTDNVHLKTDKASIEYRRWLGRLTSGGADVRGGAA